MFLLSLKKEHLEGKSTVFNQHVFATLYFYPSGACWYCSVKKPYLLCAKTKLRGTL